jgi:LPPG:FO 2-phospho-L-lactate transferase
VVTSVEYAGADRARMNDEFDTVLNSPRLSAVILCPSNPYLSIAPILALPGVRTSLQCRRAPVVAVSPIIAGQALKGPAAKIMRELGKEPSSLEIARFYRGLIDGLVVDRADASLCGQIEALGLRCLATGTVMKSQQQRAELAARVLDFAQSLQRPISLGCPA